MHTFGHYGKGQTSSSTLADWLRRLEQFIGGGFEGLKVDGVSHTGRLEEPLASSLKASFSLREVDYVVYSYATPIAWHYVNGKWFENKSKYSITTSKHQGKLGVALSILRGHNGAG